MSALFLCFCAAYALFFYRVPLGGDTARYEPLAYCLAPDELLARWCAAPIGDVWIADRIPLVALAAAVYAAAFLLGRLILSRSSMARQLDGLESTAFATGLGLSLLSLLTLAVGLGGGLRQPLIFVGAGVLVVSLSLAQAWRVWRTDRTTRWDAEQGPSRDRYLAWCRPRVEWLAVPFVLVTMGGALLPPIHFDVLEYHFQVPREWVQSGRIGYLPHNIYGNMPLGGETLVALTMSLSPGELGWWWGALSGKLVMALHAPLAALLLVSAGRRFATARAGVLAAILYLSTPWTVHVSVNGLNEGVLAYYVLAAVYAAGLWLNQRRADAGAARGYVWLAGWMAGSAAACKYTSVVLVVVPLLGFVIVTARRDRLRAVFACGMAVTLACGLWYAKNWVQMGNPVYPLMPGVFGDELRTPEQIAQFQQAHQVPVDRAGRRYSAGQAWDSLRLVWGTSLWHSPLLVPFTLLVWLRRRTLRQAALWGGGFLIFVALWWVTTHRVDRFLVPAWPLWAMVAGIGAAWSSSAVWRPVMWVVASLGLLANIVMVALPLVGSDHFLVRLEQLRDDPRLTTVSVAHQYLNQHVPAGKCALLVGDACAFDVRVPVLYNTCFDANILEQLVRGHSDAERRARLNQRGVSHVYVDWAEIARYRQPGNYGFTQYITPALLHDELEREQRLLRRVPVPDLDPLQGEMFEVVE